MTIKKGDKIKVEYTGTFEDGTVFDTTDKHGQPLEFEVGSKQLIKGFDEAVIGMDKDEEKEITLKPEEAYGEPNPQLAQKVPKDKLPKEPLPEVGMMLALKGPDGKQIPARITEVSDTDVTIDLNHPLAGKTLKFKIKIVGINEPSAEPEKEDKAEDKKEEAPAKEEDKKENDKEESCDPGECGSGCSGCQ
jgi:FKBP-type peptidyl-prolyl cis-trans isomerase 2